MASNDLGVSGVRDVVDVPKHWRSYKMTVGFYHVSYSGTCLAGLCLPPGWEGLSPSSQAGIVLLSPSQPLSLAVPLHWLLS